VGSRFAQASLARVRAGTFKARKAIPADVRVGYSRLYGQRWEAIFSAAAETPLAEAKAAHAEWLALVERRIAGLRTSPHPGLHNAAAPLHATPPIAVPQAVAVQEVANGRPIGRVDPQGRLVIPQKKRLYVIPPVLICQISAGSVSFDLD
jgi:hypothetical protein